MADVTHMPPQFIKHWAPTGPGGALIQWGTPG